MPPRIHGRVALAGVRLWPIKRTSAPPNARDEKYRKAKSAPASRLGQTLPFGISRNKTTHLKVNVTFFYRVQASHSNIFFQDSKTIQNFSTFSSTIYNFRLHYAVITIKPRPNTQLKTKRCIFRWVDTQTCLPTAGLPLQGQKYWLIKIWLAIPGRSWQICFFFQDILRTRKKSGISGKSDMPDS